VMAVPALRELRRIFDGSRITLVARPWVAGLFEGEGLADDLIAVPDRRGLANKVVRFIGEARRLRRERFDLAVLLQNAYGAALTARAAGVKRIAGYPTDLRGPMLDYVIDFEPDHKRSHEVFYYLNVAARLEKRLKGESLVDYRNAQPSLHVSSEGKENARHILASFGVRFDGPPDFPARILALNPGATNSRAKRWLPERFAETADRLAERDGFQTIILGSAGDAEAAERVAQHMRSPAAMLAGRTTIAELKAILACSSLVVSNDTGTAHVSAALGVPTVVVFGPTEHVSTRPLSDIAVVVRHQVECSPCMLKDCPIDHRCMTRVEADDVYRAAQRLLETRRDKPAQLVVL
ncbi:MAG TPA: lipopolysaccharide heptosyltransferase II, partial [Blastocatellia bacterium]|nr:lipopolysaccharide heptosyltransferase II [Blastocatellia bacterium]